MEALPADMTCRINAKEEWTDAFDELCRAAGYSGAWYYYDALMESSERTVRRAMKNC